MSFFKRLLILCCFLPSYSFSQPDTTVAVLKITPIESTEIKRLPTDNTDCNQGRPMLVREDIAYIDHFERLEKYHSILIKKNVSSSLFFYTNELFVKKKIIVQIDNYCLNKAIKDIKKHAVLVTDSIMIKDTVILRNASFINLYDFPWNRYLLLRSKNKATFRLKSGDFSLKSTFKKKEHIRQVTLFYKKKKLAYYQYKNNQLISNKKYE